MFDDPKPDDTVHVGDMTVADFQKMVHMGKYIYDYARPAVTVDVIFVTGTTIADNDILLIKRGGEPHKGEFAFPGGFMNIDETLKAAAVRELKEETGIILNEIDLDFVEMADKIDRDKRSRILSGVFRAYRMTKPAVIPADDAVDYTWANIHDILAGKYKLAFDHLDILKRFLT